ncbi:MAG: response regulator transcription factor [Anaerolineales bacterium]|nr:response regulator transcription factor [Chloroflexota bacterium]MBL6980965.1 response regulator transcription factor [Anaerolineales bacterium]
MARTSKTILVVDDERDTLALLRLALNRAGFNTLIASSWEEVADVVKEKYSQGRAIDLIVLDLMIPGRSGFDIMRSLQVVLSPLPPVIMLTAVTGFDQQVQARELGVSRYLTKPTTPTKLIQAIDEVLDEKKK